MANGRNINKALQMDPGGAAKYQAVESVVDSLRGMFSDNQAGAQQYNIDLIKLNAGIAKDEAATLNATGDDEVGYLKSQIELMKTSNLSPQDWANYFTNQELEMTTPQGKHAARGYAAVFSSEGRNNKVMQGVLAQIPAAITMQDKKSLQKEINNMIINPESVFYKTQFKPKADAFNKDIALSDIKETYKGIVGKVFDDFPQLENRTKGRESFYAAIDGSSDVAEVETKWNDVLSLFKSIHEIGSKEYTTLFAYFNSDDYFKRIKELASELSLSKSFEYDPVFTREYMGTLNFLRESKRILAEGGTPLTLQQKEGLFPAGAPAAFVGPEPMTIAGVTVEELYFNSKGQIIPSLTGKIGAGDNTEITRTDAARMNQYLNANPSIKKELFETLKSQGHNFDEETIKKYPKILNPSGG